jgi:Zn-dependent M28 family amino/carboxypeptidase
MDMIAWDSLNGPNMDVHANSSVAGSVPLAQLFADVVAAYDLTLLPVVYPNGATASDHSRFWNVGIPAILVIEDYYSDGGGLNDFNDYYHTSSDRTQYYNQSYFREMTKASLATFAHMAGIRTTCYWADVDCNNQVTAADITKVAAHWEAVAGQWNYSRVYDADADGDVDATDIQSFASAWGWSNP